MAPLFATSKLRHIGIFALVAGLYFVSGKFGLHYATISPSAAAVWAPSGIALTACLMVGDWAALPIFIAAFLVNLTTAGSFATSLGHRLRQYA